MKELRLQFSAAQADRLEAAAKRDGAESLSAFVKRAAMESARFTERRHNGHYPDSAPPSAFRREEVMPHDRSEREVQANAGDMTQAAGQ